MSERKVILLFIDAFSSDYLHENLCPHIFRMTKEFKFKNIEPIFAFQGIGATIYTGTWPNSTNIWAEYIRGDDDFICEHKFLQKILMVTDFIPNDRVSWDIRYVLFKIFGKKYVGTPNAIPAKYLKYFKTCLQNNYTDKNCFDNSIQTLFNIAQAEGISYSMSHPPTQFEHRAIATIIKNVHEDTLSDLTILHLGSLDLIGHNYGPNTKEMQTGLKKIDDAISEIIQSIKKSSNEIQLIIFSDHGMSPVYEYVNIFEILNGLPISMGKDYLMFLDSTMARFWIINPKAKKEITIALSKYPKGHILESEEYFNYHIDRLNKDHGELIFVVNDGVAIFPDYFRKYSPPKGMHGYAIPKDKPIFIQYTNKEFSPSNVPLNSIELLKMVDIFPIVLDLLNCAIPNTCESDLISRQTKD